MGIKIVIEEPSPGEEDHLIVKCRNLSPEIMRLINALKTRDDSLIAYVDSEIHRISRADVFYIETVDNKTFLYCKQNVYESRQKLYELEEALAEGDFLRVSKSVIVNLSKIKSLAPALSGRLEAKLANNEKVIISRQYVPALKKSLGI